MASAHRRADTSWVATVQAPLDRGEATAGFTVTKRGNHLILCRVDEAGPDPRFRLTALGGGRKGLSLGAALLRGHLDALVDVMNTDLAMWAAEWPSPAQGRGLRIR
jgi:hypothetical protein